MSSGVGPRVVVATGTARAPFDATVNARVERSAH